MGEIKRKLLVVVFVFTAISSGVWFFLTKKSPLFPGETIHTGSTLARVAAAEDTFRGQSDQAALSSFNFEPITSPLFQLPPGSVTSVEILDHTIEAEDIDGNSITSRTIRDDTILGRDIYRHAALDIASLTLAEGISVGGDASVTGDLTVSGDITARGALDLVGNLGIRSLAYTWPSAHDNGVLSNDGAGQLTWQTLGAASITADSLDFSEFKDALALDASTDILVDGTEVFSLTNTGTGSSFLVNDVASDTTPFVIDASGNVGIGTTSPSTKLDVNGDVNISGNLVSGGQGNALYIGSGGVTHLGFGWDNTGVYHSFTTAGGGNDNLALKLVNPNSHYLTLDGLFEATKGATIGYGGGTSLSAPSNGLAVSGNVGIGTTAPDAKLDVNGSIYSGASDQIQIAGVDNGSIYYHAADGTSFTIGTKTYTNPLIFAINSVEKMRIASSGNVGIGTTSPAAKLNVYGGNLRVENTTTAMLELVNSNDPSSYRTQIKQNYNGAHNFEIQTVYGEILGGYGGNTALMTGNVGIGTTSPTAKLDISTGNLNLDNTTNANQYGVISKGGTRFIHNFNYGNNGTVTTEGYNVFVGQDVGNLTMGSTATQTYHASYNTAVGYRSLYSNTTGYYNSAQGAASLYNNTTGYSNSAQGYGSLYNNTTGNQNSAQGAYSLYSNTTGYQNSAQGYHSLYYNTTGYSNSALGTNAGRYIADGATGRTTGNYGLYLGYNSKASADGTDNEIAIGYNAIGAGSNSVVLGNTSVTKTLLNGNVGIGTTSPSKKLQVNGGVQIGDATVNSIDFRLTRTTSGLNADANYFVATVNTPVHNWIEGGYLTGERAGTITAPNSGYPYYEEWSGNGASTIKTLGFINKTSGSFTISDMLPVLTMARTGNVGIGTTSPSSLLHVVSSISGEVQRWTSLGQNLILSYDSGTNSFNYTSSSGRNIAFNNGGNVGIGTTSPNANLVISDTGTGTTLGQLDTNLRLRTQTATANAGNEISFMGLGGAALGNDIYASIAAPVTANTSGAAGYLSFNTKATSGASSLSERMRITGDGKVGIGTTSPSYNLDVAGNIRATNYVYSNVSTITPQVLNSGPSDMQIYQSGAYSIGLWTNSAERMRVDSTGNVGIGTEGPDEKLSVKLSDTQFVDTYLSGNAWGIRLEGSSNADVATFQADGGTGEVRIGGVYSTYFPTFYSGNAEAMRITSTGNVGIGTTGPSWKLTVTNTSGASDVSVIDSTGNGVQLTASAGSGYLTTNSANPLIFRTNSAEVMRLTSGGNVGIGTTSPTAKLDISTGNLNLDNTTNANQYGVISKGGTRFIHNFNYGNNGTVTTEGYNVFVGQDVGNLTMGSTATQTYHASYNTAVGYRSLYNNTTGYSNSAQGYGSLYSNTTGYNNSAQGYASLYNNTTGYNNSAQGYASLYNNTTGYNNSALGTSAGRYIADGATGRTTGNNGLYLGYNSKASADGTDNEIAIGYNAIGAGSNSVVLGNTSVTKTLLNGNVGIGTTSPGTDLNVIGNIAWEKSSGGYVATNHWQGNNPSVGYYAESGLLFGTVTTMVGGGWSEKMRITNTGNVGIGDTSPDALLTVGSGDLFQVSSAGNVSTVGQINGTDGLVTKVNTGTCDDSVFTLDTDGNLCVDSTNGRLYYRYGGSWHYSAQTAGFQIPNYEVYAYDFADRTFDTTRPLAENDFLIPFVENFMEDGAAHGLYAKFSDVKDALFYTEQQQISTLSLQTSQHITTLAELRVAVDDQLTVIGDSLAQYEETIEQQGDRLDVLDNDIVTLRDVVDIQDELLGRLVHDIESTVSQTALFTSQIATLTEQVAALTDFYITFDLGSLGSLVIRDDDGNVDLLDGKLKARILETGLLTIEADDPEGATIGRDKIESGEKVVTVKTTAVKTGSHIIVTPRTLTAEPLAVTAVTDGEDFTVERITPASEDISFDWWIVEGE